jgi:gamma-glutamyltranspeptidase/glutathione hydrolase
MCPGLRVIASSILLALAGQSGLAAYVGSASSGTAPSSIQATALEIMGSGGGTGAFVYKGGGNAVDAAVAAALTACVVNTGNCSLGGYGGHMLIWKAGLDGTPQFITCIDFGSDAGSLASSNMFVGSVDPTTGLWTAPGRAANQYGWKAVGVPGTFAGLYVAQTNYGRKISGTNFFPFAEILKPALSRIALGQAAANSSPYYSVSSLSNLVMDLYTNSPGYRDANGNPNPFNKNDPYGVFYTGDIAQDIAAAMAVNGGLVTYSDMTNYRPREVAPYMRHFSPRCGTPAWVCGAVLGSSALSVMQELAMLEALNWTNGPIGTWDSPYYWHSRAQIARLMWKDHFQYHGDPWAGVLPPNILGNGNTNFCDQMLAHATNSFPFSAPADPTEIPLTNSQFQTIRNAVDAGTNPPVLVHWNDIRYGTCNISTSDQWGNCVAVTFSMGGGYGAQVGVTNRGLVFGQGMALFDPRPGWPNSIAPGKRQVDNMCPIIVIPDAPGSQTNGTIGGRPALAVGATGGSTIENTMAMTVIKYLTEPPSTPMSLPSTWLYNFEANNTIYMRPSYPSGVQSYLTSVGLTAPGGPPSAGEVSYAEGFVAPAIQSQPIGGNVSSGSSITLTVAASGLPIFYQWFSNGVALVDGGAVSGAHTPQLTINPVTTGAAYWVAVTNGAASVVSATATVTIGGAPAITSQPASATNVVGTTVNFSVSAIGSAPLNYRWFKNGAPLTDGGNVFGSGTTQLSITGLGSSDVANYSVTVTNSMGAVTSAVATLTVINPYAYLTPLWSVGPLDGTEWMNTNTTLTANVPNQRTIAYNALSNHLYVISRSSSTTSNFVLYALNATNGSLLYTLKTNGIQSNVGKGGIGLVGIGVADDGAIYACNMATDASGAAGADPTSYFRVYRWANGGSNTLPTQIFQGDPSGATTPLRWGDTLAVRGSGTNTQIILDMTYSGTTAGTNGYAAVLTPANAFMTNFVSRWFATTNFGTVIGRSLEFDPTTNAIWQKVASQSLYKTTFYPAISLGGTRIASSNVFAASAFSTSLWGVGLDFSHDLAAGVFPGSGGNADSLNLYDVTDLTAPSLIWQNNFPTTPAIANANKISQTFFKNGLVFSIDPNNGMMALQLHATTSGQWFLYEPFNYSNIGSPVSSNTPANWTYGGIGVNDLNVAPGNLTYPGLLDSLGNSVTNGGAGLGVRRLFGTNFSTGQLYFSALFRMNDLGYGLWNGLASMAGGLSANDNTSFRLQVLVKSNTPSGYVIGTQKSGTGVTASFDNIERHVGETVFVVGMYDFSTSPNVIKLWINPSYTTFGLASEPNGFISAFSGTDGFIVDRFNIRQNAASGSSSVPAAMQWDELRVGLSWADVTPPGAVPVGAIKLTNVQVLPNGSLQFGYTNLSAVSYTVYASTNLVDWTPAGTATQAAPGYYQFTDESGVNVGKRFYELRWP